MKIKLLSILILIYGTSLSCHNHKKDWIHLNSKECNYQIEFPKKNNSEGDSYFWGTFKNPNDTFRYRAIIQWEFKSSDSISLKLDKFNFYPKPNLSKGDSIINDPFSKYFLPHIILGKKKEKKWTLYIGTMIGLGFSQVCEFKETGISPNQRFTYK